MPFTRPPLPYPTNALEPHIDAQTMEIHHDKHHGAYVNNLNAALEKAPELQGKSLDDLLKNLNAVPESIRTAVRNNGGGHWNHSMFWQIMSPKGGGAPSGKLADAINKAFGSVEKFKEEFAKMGASNFGSGWTWLVQRPDGSLGIVNTSNAGTPITGSDKPLFTCDVWEHAYYIDYRNARPKYLENFWNVVNWEFAASNMA